MSYDEIAVALALSESAVSAGTCTVADAPWPRGWRDGARARDLTRSTGPWRPRGTTSPRAEIELSGSMMFRVRATVAPFRAHPGLRPRRGHRARRRRLTHVVSARILTTALRRALREPTLAPEAIDLVIEDERLRRSRSLSSAPTASTCAPQAEVARDEVHAVVLGVARPGPRAFTRGSIDIVVSDVVVGDPHVV